MTQISAASSRRRGRPAGVNREEVARAALTLFARHGFENTTVTDVAAALHIGRRTLFRYFESKNDMVWGDFDRVIARLRAALANAPPDEPILRTLSHAVIASNQYEAHALAELRLRMILITRVPALQAHSTLRYNEWRRVVAEFAARRLNQQPDDLMPLLIGHMALGASTAAFARWAEHPGENLEDHLCAGYTRLERGFEDVRPLGADGRSFGLGREPRPKPRQIAPGDTHC